MHPTILPLLIFLFPLAFSPGPGNMMFAAAGARFGLRATLPANAGYHLATLAGALVIGFGFAEAKRTLPDLFAVIKLAGALYVLWLAAALMRAGAAGSAEARPIRFGGGAVLLLLNPKAYVIIALMFTQFLDGSSQPATGAVILIAAVFTLNNLAAFVAWTVLGDVALRRFRGTGRERYLNITFGVILGAVGLWMLVP